jgi:streptogrisin C
MMRTTLVRTGGTVLLAAGVALTIAMPANAATAGGSSASQIQTALQRDLGLTPQQAEVRFQQERIAWSKDRTLRIALGDDYAGSRFDDASGKLLVNVADPSRAAEVTSAGALVKVVEHSAAELNAEKSKLDRGITSRPTSVTGWYVDETANDVVVSVYGNDSTAVTWAKGLGANVRIEKLAERPQTLWNLISGQAIRTGGARCSLGFNARSGNTRYVITAGHCTNIGSSWSGSGGTIGTRSASSFPGNDYGRITVTSSAAVSTNDVDRYSASSSDAQVTGASGGNNNAAVCRSGSTTGWHCGRITGLNQQVCYQEGCVNQTIRTNVCAEPGDSGGALVTSPNSEGQVTALGLTSGGSGNCSSGGTTFYQPIIEALGGAQLVTS